MLVLSEIYIYIFIYNYPSASEVILMDMGIIHQYQTATKWEWCANFIYDILQNIVAILWNIGKT